MAEEILVLMADLDEESQRPVLLWIKSRKP